MYEICLPRKTSQLDDEIMDVSRNTQCITCTYHPNGVSMPLFMHAKGYNYVVGNINNLIAPLMTNKTSMEKGILVLFSVV